MLQGRSERAISWVFVLGAYLLSNLSAWLFVIWLVPGVVLLEAAIWLVIAIVAVAFLAKQDLLPDFAGGVAKSWFLIPFVLFAGASILWSIDAQISLSRWLVLVCTIVVGGYIGLRFGLTGIQRSLTIFGLITLLLSAAIVLLVPRIGIMNYYSIQGAWKGLYWHKNHMGAIAAFVCVLLLLGVLNSILSRSRSAVWWIGLYLLSLVFLLQTDSVGAYITLILVHAVVLLALGLIRFRAQLRLQHYLTVLAVLVAVLIIAYLNLGRLLSVFDRSANLTGRVPMWGHLFDTYLSQRPVAGYGFNAFWYADSHRVAMQQMADYPDPIVIADNGFIDILINTGWVGLGLFLLFYTGLWIRVVQYSWRAADAHGLFPLALMAYTLFANVSWSVLFENESFFMLSMIAVMFALANRPSTTSARDRADQANG